jgi:hypothetical protein
MSLGDLTEKDVEGIRGGSIADPPLSHVIALASAFGAEPSYLVNRYAEAALDRETVETSDLEGRHGQGHSEGERTPAGSGEETGPGHSAAVRRCLLTRGGRSWGAFRGPLAGFGDLPLLRLLPWSRIGRVGPLVQALERRPREDPPR